jgi:putative transposase
MRECSLPTKAEVALCHHLHVHQSQHWTWTHQVTAEHRLSGPVRARETMLRWYVEHDRNVSRTCRHFGVSRPTFYRWQTRLRETGLRGLEDRSHRPQRVRQPQWTLSQLEAVHALREQYPCWGKAKLCLLLARDGHELSVSMVGRILHRLKQSGQLQEGKRRGARTVPRMRPYAKRKPKDYCIAHPGDLVQVDTKDLRFGNGTTFKHLSLIDNRSRYAAAEIGVHASSQTVAAHLDRMLSRLPFPVKAVQVDGGSEFKSHFETYCQEHHLKLFVLPPRSPKLNGKVERLQRTFEDECYRCLDVPLRVAHLSAGLRAYEKIYNHVRPHQALGYLTPAEYLAAQEASA